MTEEGRDARDSKSTWIIVLAVIVTVLLGAIIGFVVSGGLSDDATGDSTPSTTAAVIAPTTTVPVGTAPPAPSTTALPVTTDPPGQLTILAIEDTYTDASDPAEVNGFDSVIELEEDPPDVKQGLVRFEVAGIPDGVTIESAELRLTTTAPSAAAIAVHLVDGEWNESETSAANAPARGERVATVPAGGANGEPLLGDLTGVVTGPGSISFFLISTTENTTEIFSRENGANGPSLILHWTP
jgi:hypothetical protein